MSLLHKSDFVTLTLKQVQHMVQYDIFLISAIRATGAKKSLKMKVLITGDGGFIGSCLRERLLNGGNDVFCVDNFYTGMARKWFQTTGV